MRINHSFFIKKSKHTQSAVNSFILENDFPTTSSQQKGLQQSFNIKINSSLLKIQDFGNLIEKTERQNIFLRKQKEKQKLLHQGLKNSIDRLNSQQIAKEASNLNSQVDCFISAGIEQSNKLNKKKQNMVSLNQKLMVEGIISNTTQVSFIKKHKKKSIEKLNDANPEAEELFTDQINKGNCSRVQLKSKNDLDDILGSQNKKERKEIIQRVQKILEEKRKKDPKQQETYNKWYIDPQYRGMKKVDRLKNLYPYIFDQDYLYNNMDNYEDLYKGNPFDEGLNSKRLKLKSDKQTQLMHIRGMLASQDVIRDYTKKLVQSGERIPLFMKEVFTQDSGKLKARSSLQNRYYSTNETLQNI